MRSRFFSLVGACVLVAAFVTPAFSVEPTKDSLDVVKENLAQKKAILVDVREEDEWKAGHLSQATAVPLSMLKQGAGAKEFATVLAQQVPKDRIVYVHCKSGKRALESADILKKFGYDVRSLKPGYEDLLQAGFPKAK